MVQFRYWVEEHRGGLLFLFACLLIGSLAVGIYFGVSYYLWKEEEETEASSLVEKKEEPKEEKEKTEEVETVYLVDIKGAISQPGVYEMKVGSRVQDVITVAGGLLENADVSLINLSKKVVDEMVIYIYTKEEVSSFISPATPVPCPSTFLENDACISESSSSSSFPISLNEATLEELMQLPGIGEKKAEAILSYREEHHGFTNIEELKNVSGIGESIFEEIQEYLTL